MRIKEPDTLETTTVRELGDAAQTRCHAASLLLILCLFTVLAGLAGCSSLGGNARDTASTSTVMFAGVIPERNNLSAPYKSLWIDQIEQSLQKHSQYRFIRYSQARSHLAQFHDSLMADYAEDGFLRQGTLAALADSGLPAKYALLVYLHDSRDQRGVLSRTARNRYGELIDDRVSTTYVRAREHVVTGSVFDLGSGKRVWHRSYAAKPATSRTYTRYHGSSFAGSVAALFANRLVNGREQGAYPNPPPSGETIRGLSNELVYQMFNGDGHL